MESVPDKTEGLDCECDGRKHILTQNGWEPCICLKQERLSRNCLDAGIPRYISDYSFKKWFTRYPKMANLKGDIDRFIRLTCQDKAERFRVAYGRSKSGKLTLAYLIARGVIKRGGNARIVTLGELVESRFNDSERIEEVLNSSFAVIRLGMEESHKYNGPTLETVHFGRKAREKPTMYTSRYGPATWAEKYGEAIADAIAEPEGDAIWWDLNVGRVVVP